MILKYFSIICNHCHEKSECTVCFTPAGYIFDCHNCGQVERVGLENDSGRYTPETFKADIQKEKRLN